MSGEAEGFAQFIEARERALQRTAWLLTKDWTRPQRATWLLTWPREWLCGACWPR